MAALFRATAPAVVLAVVHSLGAVAATQERIAFSEKHGFDVHATSLHGAWCGAQVDLRFDAREPGFYRTEAFETVTRKVGKVVSMKCPEANVANITGHHDELPVYQGIARASAGWQPKDLRGAALPGARAAPASPPVPTATGAPSRLAPLAVQKAPTDPSGAAATESGTGSADAWRSELEALMTTHKREQPAGSAAAGSREEETLTISERTAQAGGRGPASPALSSRTGAPRQFTVGGWTLPPSPDQALALADGVLEVTVKTKDETCALRYNRIKSRMVEGSLVMTVRGVSCPRGLLDGQGVVRLADLDGRDKGVLSGMFSKGYFTNQEHWDLSFVGRMDMDAGVSPGNEPQPILFTYLASDEGAKEHYLAGLTSERGRWSLCTRPIALVLTEEEGAILESGAASSRAVVAANELLGHCPDAQEAYVYVASDVLFGGREDERLFYRAWLRRTEGGTWHLANGANYLDARLRKELEEYWRQQLTVYESAQQQWMEAKNLHDRLTRASFRERLATLYQVEGFDDPSATTAWSAVTGKAANVVMLVKVDEADGDRARTTWPVEMSLMGTVGKVEKAGWYVVGGTIDGTQLEAGAAVAPLRVAWGHPCDEPYCTEANDPIAIVQEVREMPEWQPEQPPAKPTKPNLDQYLTLREQ